MLSSSGTWKGIISATILLVSLQEGLFLMVPSTVFVSSLHTVPASDGSTFDVLDCLQLKFGS